MRIGIDARMLGPQTGGIGRYTEQLVQHLLCIPGDETYVLFLTDENWDLVEEHERIEKVRAPIHWYGIKEQILFPRIIAAAHVDFMHFPHWNVPLFYRGTFVVTVHDLIMFHYRRPDATTLGPVLYWIKDRIHRIIVKRAVEKSEQIITPTQWVKDDIAQTFDVCRKKISVTHEAPIKAQENIDSSVLDRLRITHPYALYVGSGFPHENLERLIAAWDLVREEAQAQLVFVGSKNRFYDRLEASVDMRQDILFTGFVSDEELASLYSHARAFVFPSLSEGFGLPPLEAMTYGVPVVSSNASCMPEVMGVGALYFDPKSTEHMAEQILRVFEDEDLRADLVVRAREELKRYSWRKMTEETYQIYRKLS